MEWKLIQKTPNLMKLSAKWKKKKLTFRNLEIILQEQHMSVRNIISQ